MPESLDYSSGSSARCGSTGLLFPDRGLLKRFGEGVGVLGDGLLRILLDGGFALTR